VEARDSSRSAQVEARLRGEITNLRSEREDALASAAESKRKANLLEEEVRLVKAKLGRLAQEKLRQERDSRAALSLARSMDSHAMADTDFYKRKVNSASSIARFCEKCHHLLYLSFKYYIAHICFSNPYSRPQN
jgi:hypothetical protein